MSEPIAYTALQKGAVVTASGGERLGTVEHVLQDPSLDLFDGLAVRTHHGLRFVDARQVTGITTDGVDTTIDESEVAGLPAPDGDAVLDADPEQYEGEGLTAWWGRTFRRSHWLREKD
ncbi:hypothetical protein HII28_10975 [Planctomonas sp. JC2975]|uniref:hypothetical protein n=1 Tax=Planctomonas sp. JC2975 TaxID=2729626 RepID=UPI0014752F1B|nr:hypothetical protein [Planctomonas sp. JC2975]NNC12398.1 hypothetical protein [Planctomonas sp. JC2975]